MTSTGRNESISSDSSGEIDFVRRLARRRGVNRALAISLAGAALLAGIATYGALAGSPPFGDNPDIVLLLLNLDLILLLLLSFFIVRRVVTVWSERRRGSAGSRLHVKLVILFGLISVTPAIVVGVFSVSFLNFGIESWFSERVRTALDESMAAAKVYLQEHKQDIRADAVAAARDLGRDADRIMNRPAQFNQLIKLQAKLRNLTEAVVFDAGGRVLARSGLTYLLEFEPIPPGAVEKARAGEVALMTSDSDDRVRALVRIDSIAELFLYVGRLVDPTVLGHMERTKGAVAQFKRLELERSDLQINFAMIFVVVGLLLLLAAVWVGLMLATQLSGPISALIAATEKVRAGDLEVQVAEDTADEVGSLSRAFNRMTSELLSNRNELMAANQQLDERRRFTETVLSGVSAGVIGLDSAGRIDLPNRSASELLGIELDEMIGQELVGIVPEMTPLLARINGPRSARSWDGEIKIIREGATHTLLIRIETERGDGETTGFVVTFDDVSQLLAAQRKAAWADVARRIAHEIKNPLTPIQLSAERLKRKYLSEIKTDPDTFVTCTDTIVHHVEDIERMVDEFSSFARLPAPTMREEDLTDLCRQALFLYRNSQPHIEFSDEISDAPLIANCDGRQISQALTNLLKNAVEAIEGRETGTETPGLIAMRLSENAGKVVIEIEDNGKGLPVADREKLTDPYFTTRGNGTGLGLAIVRKTMDDHRGRILLLDGESGGAKVRMEFTKELPVAADETDQANSDKAAHGA